MAIATTCQQCGAVLYKDRHIREGHLTLGSGLWFCDSACYRKYIWAMEDLEMGHAGEKEETGHITFGR